MVNPKINILVVDDSGAMRAMFKQMLNKAGFENIILAEDGLDGIEKIQESRPDLIISDWNMPGMDGLEFLQWVRKTAPYHDIPFIMATAQADKGQQIAVQEAGGNGHLPKPFDADQIRDAVHRVFAPEGAQEKVLKTRKMIDGRVEINVAHIQITDHLALGTLKHRIENGEVTPRHFYLKIQKKPGWNPIQEGLESGELDCAFVLAPIAMDLFAYDSPIQLVLLAHKNGSTFVRNRRYDLQDSLYDSLQSFYKYKVVNIPHKMSIHHMLAHQFLTELGLKPGVPGKKAINVRFEVVPPINMPGIMKDHEDVAGFMVAEPIAAKAISLDIAGLEFFSSTRWSGHPCCIVAMQQDFIQSYPDAVQEFVTLLIEAGRYVEQDKVRAADIAVSFLDPDGSLGLSTTVLEQVFSQPLAIRMDDLFPVIEDFEKIQRYMHDVMDIGRLIDLEKFIDTTFAQRALAGF